MAIRACRDVVIKASVAEILNVLADVDKWPSWWPMYDRVDVLDTFPEGKVRRARLRGSVMGLSFDQLVDFHWGPDWVVWDASRDLRQTAEHAEYALTPQGLAVTHVRFHITLEPLLPLPGFFARRLTQKVMESATDGLSKRLS